MGVEEKYREYVMTGFVKRVEPVVADHGDGALLYDADGTEYIDCFAGISVTNAGHGNRAIIEAAKAQADKLVHACIVDAAKLSGAKLRIFAHNDLNDLEDKLKWAHAVQSPKSKVQGRRRASTGNRHGLGDGPGGGAGNQSR